MSLRQSPRAAALAGVAFCLLSCAARSGTPPRDAAESAVERPPRTTALDTLPASRVGSSSARPHVQARGDRFEVVRAGHARPLFLRGVNLGAGPAGHFPGEFAIDEAQYRRWIQFARSLHANAIRVYALHPPAFYRALAADNAAHPEAPLWLFQEVWTELPETNDFWTPAYRRAFEQEIRTAIEAVHGDAVVAPRPGHAAGRYDADVSPWLAGWLLGREWEPFAVRETERLHPDSTRYRGTLFAVDKGTAMECWLARMCDVAALHERERYGLAHPVSFVNWPTLDPMRHPTEFERGGVEAEHDEDAYAVDPVRIRPIAPIGAASGFLGYFANYHVYPYYPDFMNLDPGYAAFRDRHGACRYAGYLADLKAHTPGIPLLIGEYGVASSRGIAHLQPEGMHHGGASEEEQGRQDARLLEDIVDSGASGSLLFALFDEWFKVNWLVRDGESPRDRDPLWHNVLDPEECYGLIAFDPPPAIRVDGDRADWAGIAPYATADSAAPGPAADSRRARGGRRPLRALYATSDQTHFYLRLDLAPDARPEDVRALGVAFDVLDPERGDKRLPAPLDARWSRGAERMLLIEPALDAASDRGRRAALFADASTRTSAFARVREGNRWETQQGPKRPVANDDGRYLPMVVETNRERVSRSGQFYPAERIDTGRLAYGSEWMLDDARRSIEVAIPWGLLGVGDPSSHAVIDDRDGTRDIETTRTAGIALLAWSVGAEVFRADSLGPARSEHAGRPPEEISILGPPGTTQVYDGKRVTIISPRDLLVVWNGWDVPITVERTKTSARVVREAFERVESREAIEEPKLDRRP